MTQTVASWFVILCALVAANLPFVNQRLMLVLPLPEGRKNLAIRLAEVLIWYGVAGLIGVLLERQLGQRSPQGWEFYAVTLSLFFTFAFPGFVFRYLMRRR